MEKKRSKNHKSYSNDRFNTETPQEIRQEESEKLLEDGGEEFESYSGADYTEVYNLGRLFLKERGYDLRPFPGGAYCDHEIYKEASITSHDSAGYNPDSSLKVWIPIDAEDFRKVKDYLVDFIDQSASPKTTGKFWNVIYSPTPERRKPIYELAKRELLLENTKALKEGEFKASISLTGTTYNPHYATLKWIPQLEWFDKRIQQVEIKDLITILPEAEREILALCIGRALIGENDSLTTDNVQINHTFRTMAILVGRDAGLGKSTLIEYITNAMKECGYTVANLQKSSARFGWGKIINSDLAYNDDLTPRTQKHIITSDHIKSIVSSGEITVEDKGVDGQVQKARCVLLANSNDYAKTDFYQMDSGMKSRVKLLDTYSQLKLEKLLTELEGVSEGSYSLCTEEHWNHLVNKLETSHIVLGLWFLHLCAERFRKSIGLVLKPTVRVSKHPNHGKVQTPEIEYEYVNLDSDGKSVNTLYDQIVNYSEELKIQVDRDCTKDFVYFWRYCWAVSDAYDGIPYRKSIRHFKADDKATYVEEKRLSKPTLDDFQKLISSMSNSINVFISDADLKNLLKQDKDNYGIPNKFHLYDFFDNLMMDSVCFNSAFSQLQKDRANGVPVSDIFKNVLHHFISKDGFRLSGSLIQITDMWNRARDMDELFIETHERLMPLSDYKALQLVVESCYKSAGS
jgi:hypothetical protein